MRKNSNNLVLMYPILFQIGPVTFKTLGIFLAFAFLASSFVLISNAIKRKMNLDFISDHLISFLLVTLLSSRFFFIVEHWYKYTNDLLAVFKVQDGGFSFWGGLIGFIGILFFWSLRKKSSFWKWFDLIVLAAMLAFALIQIGFFFSGDNYGNPTSLPWGVIYDNPEVRFTDPVHPTQIYAFILYFLNFLFLFFFSKKKRNEGIIGLTGILFFTLIAFALDFFLGDRITLFYHISIFQIFSFIAFGVSLVFLMIHSQAKYKNINNS